MLQKISVYSSRFSTRLIFGFFVLIVVSALAGGAPAYWLTRSELERQTWNNVENASQSARSLLQAEESRLANLATLFSERPTLHRLIHDKATSELTSYLAAFQAQSQLDLLLFCGQQSTTPTCSDSPNQALSSTEAVPRLLVRQPVRDEQSNALLGTAIAGIALDDAFWRQMATNTGVEFSLLNAAGSRLASSISGTIQLTATAPILIRNPADSADRYQLNLAGQQYYAQISKLPEGSVTTPSALQLEIALPVDELLTAKQRTLLAFAASTCLIALLGVLLAGWYVRRLTQPLWQLTRAADRIGKGNFEAAIPAFVEPLEVATLSTALIKSQSTMLRALEERSDFLANVSHEFQTPLSTLQAALELVADEQEDLSAGEMRQLLKPAHMSLVGLKNLIDNLLQSSSIEAGHFPMHKRSIELGDVIEDVRRLVQPLLDRRNQPLHLPNADDLPLLQADPARLTQVLVNLLVNASKYSPVGTQIDLTVEVLQNSLRIAVADRGPGIPPAERSNLFRRFVRMAHQSGEQAGVGLGLHVVKTIVEAHGGAVGVDGRANGGSVFWFTLPIL